MKQSIAAEIQAFMDLYTSTWPFSGSILVSQKGEVLFKQGYELASQEYKIPNTPQTKHRTCSITKQFTAMAIMILHERGKLNIADQAVKYLPDYQALDERITIHHLLSHTSGLQYKFGTQFENHLNACSNKQEGMLDAYRNLPLLFNPGEAWHYSNFGYYLLGCILENVSGLSYDVFFDENIFKPLNMNDTGVERDKKIVENLATGYYLNNDALIRFKYMDLDHAFGSGDIYSTVEDLALWDRALYTDALVSKETLKLIFTPYGSSGESESGEDDYGYGWFIDSKFGRNRISHGGGGLGFLTELHRYEADEVCVVVLSNYGFTAVTRLAEIMAAIVFEEKYIFPNRPETFPLEPDEFENLVGTYVNDIEKFTVKKEDDKMFFVIDDAYIIPMYPTAKNRFHQTWIDESYVFYTDEDGDACFIGAKKVKD